MTSTTHSEFNAKTEALDVAKAFAGNIHGKTILVTGANPKGVGFTTAEAFASQSPAHLILLGRTPSKAQESIDSLKAQYPDVDYRYLQADLSSQQSVRAAAAEFLSWSDIPALDILVNNAGMALFPERVITPEGIELTFATNHIGHFLFTCLIMPKLIKAAEGKPKGTTRIVNVTSASPMSSRMRWSDRNFEKKNKDLPEKEQPSYHMHKLWGVPDPEERSYLALESYNQSKVANLLFTIAASKRLYEKYGILSVAAHPGVLTTELGRTVEDWMMAAVVKMQADGLYTRKSQGAGASTSMVAALDPKLSIGEPKNGKENWGSYLVDCQINGQADPLAESSEEAERLWELSEQLVKEKFSW